MTNARLRNKDYPIDDDVRAEIVQRLACYETSGEIHKDLLTRGYTISLPAVTTYNPEHDYKARRLAKRWRELFYATREAFLAETAKVPVAHRAVRLKRLEAVYSKAMEDGDLKEANKAIEQAAKEMGNVYTNVSKVQGSVTQAVTVEHTTIDEKRNMLADRIAEALARMPKPKAEATKH